MKGWHTAQSDPQAEYGQWADWLGEGMTAGKQLKAAGMCLVVLAGVVLTVLSDSMADTDMSGFKVFGAYALGNDGPMRAQAVKDLERDHRKQKTIAKLREANPAAVVDAENMSDGDVGKQMIIQAVREANPGVDINEEKTYRDYMRKRFGFGRSEEEALTYAQGGLWSQMSLFSKVLVIAIALVVVYAFVFAFR